MICILCKVGVYFLFILMLQWCVVIMKFRMYNSINRLYLFFLAVLSVQCLSAVLMIILLKKPHKLGTKWLLIVHQSLMIDWRLLMPDTKMPEGLGWAAVTKQFKKHAAGQGHLWIHNLPVLICLKISCNYSMPKVNMCLWMKTLLPRQL